MEHYDIAEIIKRARGVVSRSTIETKLSSRVRSFKGDENDQKIITTVREKASKSNVKAVIRHGEHIHIIHDCTLSNGSCRCWHFASTRRYTPKTLFRELNEEKLRALFEYHLFNGGQREVLYFKIGETEYKPGFPNRDESVQPEGSEYNGDSIERNVETCTTEDKILRSLDASGRSRDIESSDDDVQTYEILTGEGEEPKRKRRRRGYQSYGEEETEKIYNKLIQICASPITDGVNTIVWNHPGSKYKFLNAKNTLVKNANNALDAYFSQLSLRELRDFYERRVTTPMWSAMSLEKFFDTYFDIETSIYKAMQLLIWQNCSDGLNHDYSLGDPSKWEFPLYNYIRDLITLLDRHAGKANTHYYISPPNAGKNTFFDMIADILLSHGNMSDWNRYSRFPCQMLDKVRIIFWNEPNCEKRAFNELKKILGGDKYAADIKNQSHALIKTTPCILTGNYDIFKNDADEAFAPRINYYYWRAAPFLKENKKFKLHPETLFKLIRMAENYFQQELI